MGGSTALVVRMTRSFVFLRDRESKIVVASNYASQVTVPDDEDEETALLCVGKIHQKCHPRLRHLAMQLAFGSRWRICHSTADTHHVIVGRGQLVWLSVAIEWVHRYYHDPSCHGTHRQLLIKIRVSVWRVSMDEKNPNEDGTLVHERCNGGLINQQLW